MRRTAVATGWVASGRKSVLVGAVVAAVTLSACTSGSSDTAADEPPASTSAGGSVSANPSTTAPSSTAPVVEAAVITTNPESNETQISPADPVTVTIAKGTLTSVTLVNAAGRSVKGALAADGSSWRTAEVLGFDKTYRLTATGKNAQGVPVTKKSVVATLAPNNMTMPSITDIYGTTIAKGATYGVGMVTRVHFDEPVDRKAAEKKLSVTTSPKVTGGWYWNDDQNAFWRPQSYFPTGTKVTVSADVYGTKLGAGLYGQDDRSTSFTIGAKHVSIASPNKHKVRVFVNDKLVRTMNTSMGKGGYEPGNDSIHYWTMNGTYTVINHENPATMSSGSYGVSKSSPNYYPPEKVYWSTKISTDGIYLHELNSTIYAQGHSNVSHGCLNLRTSDAKFFYKLSRVGDIVTVLKDKTGGPTINFDQGGQWSVPWSKWLAGSALT